MRQVEHPPSRALKFRQAAIVYLHYGILYLCGARVLLDRGLFPATRGPVWAWFVAGTLVGAIVVWGLWWWRSVWFARVVWVLVALRLPSLVESAFFGSALGAPAGLALAAAVIVLINLWFLARAAWDV